MGAWRQFFGLEKRTMRVGPAELFREMFGARPVKSGASVTTNTALEITTVLACARVIAEDVAGLPRGLYQRQGRNRLALSDDALQVLLDQPNEWQTGAEFIEMLTIHAVLAKGGYAIKNTVNGVVQELLPLQPGWVTVRQAADWTLSYSVQLPDGGPAQIYSADQILHLRGPSWDGFAGLDVVCQAREAIGLSMALEESHALLHKNGAQAAGTYSVEGSLSDVEYRRLDVAIRNQLTGGGKFNPVILDRGGKFTSSTMTGVDAQHIETRKFQVEEICRAMRVFPQMVGHSDKASTFASAEQFFLAHVKYTLLPWIRRWEGVCQRDLIGATRTKAGVYVRHNVAALERADIKTRYAAYQTGLAAGWMLRSDARELEDMDPVAGFGMPTLPLNTSILDANGLPIPASVTPHTEPPGDPNASAD